MLTQGHSIQGHDHASQRQQSLVRVAHTESQDGAPAGTRKAEQALFHLVTMARVHCGAPALQGHVLHVHPEKAGKPLTWPPVSGFPRTSACPKNLHAEQTRHQTWLSGCMQGSPGHLDCPRTCVPETHGIMPGHEPVCRVLAASRPAKNLHDSTCRILIGEEPAEHQRHHAWQHAPPGSCHICPDAGAASMH